MKILYDNNASEKNILKNDTFLYFENDCFKFN